MKKRGFTLIELIAVLVILAILALIVTPLVLNIIRKARITADKRSIDAYGRSIELAVADYLIENGTFPTSIEELTIEYSRDRVVCATTNLNSDSSVYLAECTVGGRNIDYTYGIDKTEQEGPSTLSYTAYNVGQTIEYKGINFYVIEESTTTDRTVKLLKAEPLTYEEVTIYSNGTGASTYDGTTYGGMQYHSNSNNYETSYIKQAVDAWTNAKLGENGYEEARLITLDELTNNLGYELFDNGSVVIYQKTEDTPGWVYNSNYWYWTMSPNNDSASDVWGVGGYGSLHSGNNVDGYFGAVRPVITILKSALN